MTAEQYLRQTLGDLMFQLAILRADLDQTRQALAEAQRAAAAPDRQETP
jgi:hypothetical protein